MRSMSVATRLTAICSAVVALAQPAFAHHSAAAYDTQTEVRVMGTVVHYRHANPHIYLTLEARKDDGSTAAIEVEAGAASVLNGLGFSAGSVASGDVVTVVGNPARAKPGTSILGRELYKSDGSYLPLNIRSRSVYEASTATATSIAGTWFSPSSEFYAFLGDASRWALTEEGRASAANANERNAALKNCVPVGAPTLMFYPVASTIAIQQDRVVITVDWMDSERVVYLDGRAHPPANETFLQGHSVGRWEGKALVVETTNFKEHPLGLSLSLPASAQKRLTERFAPSEDGKSLDYSGTVEDPLYLSSPVEWSGMWEYRPNMPHSNQKCDPEVAQRFLLE
jgi:hypothetical protein